MSTRGLLNIRRDWRKVSFGGVPEGEACSGSRGSVEMGDVEAEVSFGGDISREVFEVEGVG